MTPSQPYMRAMPRRPAVEQKILTIIRAATQRIERDDENGGQRAPRMSAHAALFEALSREAAARALHIRAPDAPFVHEDELRLLAWLAVAQRMAGIPAPLEQDPSFFDLILDCARQLGELGLKLPPRSMINADQ